MKIIRIGIYKMKIPLKDPFVISLGPLYAAENLIVCLETAEGLKGFGECSPFRTIHGESIHTCFETARELARLFIEKKPSSSAEALAFSDQFIFGNTSVKSAFDIAFHDLEAQEAGVPLYKFLGAGKNRSLETDYTVSLDQADKMQAAALKIKGQGYSSIKVKLGKNATDDLLRLQKIRESVGNEILLRVDANQGWSAEEAKWILPKLSGFNIQHCEEPVSRREFMQLPELRKISSVPLMADESCFDHIDFQRLLEMKACDMVNIKLGKSSGLTNAKKMLRIAEKNDLPVQIGGFLESRLGFTAAAHLALCSNSVQFIDFDTPLMFSEDPVEGGIVYERGGRIRIPEIPGLGAIIPDNILAGLEQVIIS